jgi:hypothetical protein
MASAAFAFYPGRPFCRGAIAASAISDRICMGLREWLIPITGTTSAAHALNNAEALDWEMDNEEFSAIDQAYSPLKR